jgi:hypothetical protein
VFYYSALVLQAKEHQVKKHLLLNSRLIPSQYTFRIVKAYLLVSQFVSLRLLKTYSFLRQCLDIPIHYISCLLFQDLYISFLCLFSLNITFIGKYLLLHKLKYIKSNHKSVPIFHLHLKQLLQLLVL